MPITALAMTSRKATWIGQRIVPEGFVMMTIILEDQTFTRNEQPETLLGAEVQRFLAEVLNWNDWAMIPVDVPKPASAKAVAAAAADLAASADLLAGVQTERDAALAQVAELQARVEAQAVAIAALAPAGHTPAPAAPATGAPGAEF